MPTNFMLEPKSNRDLWTGQKLLLSPATLRQLHCGRPFSSCEGTWETKTLLFKVPWREKQNKRKQKQKNKNFPSCLFWLQGREHFRISRGSRRVLYHRVKAIKLTSFPLSLEQTLKLCLLLQTGLSRGPLGVVVDIFVVRSLLPQTKLPLCLIRSFLASALREPPLIGSERSRSCREERLPH